MTAKIPSRAVAASFFAAAESVMTDSEMFGDENDFSSPVGGGCDGCGLGLWSPDSRVTEDSLVTSDDEGGEWPWLIVFDAAADRYFAVDADDMVDAYDCDTGERLTPDTEYYG
jgi:hypothetical protein